MNKHDRQHHPEHRCGRDAGRAAIQVLVKKDVEQIRTATGSFEYNFTGNLFAMLSGNPVCLNIESTSPPRVAMDLFHYSHSVSHTPITKIRI
jgi:hypothetical protein